MAFQFSAQVLRAFPLVVLLGGFASAAHATVTISKKPTRHLKCTAGVCLPKGADANLNVTDLANMLASGDVKVVADSVAKDVDVRNAVSWTSTSRLTLDGYHSVIIEAPVTVAGSGAMTLVTNDSGSAGNIWFVKKGQVQFWDVSSSLIINGNAYTLASSLSQLANAIAGNISGFFALSANYDASSDGTYAHAPIPFFGGTFEGLGNQISHLSIDDTADGENVALFGESDGKLRDIALSAVRIRAEGANDWAGALAGVVGGIWNCSVSGSVAGGQFTGGLAGETFDGQIMMYSRSSANVSASNPKNTGGAAGGLMGGSGGIEFSYSTGKVSGGNSAVLGGLSGIDEGNGVEWSYSSATVAGGRGASVGGLVGAPHGHEAQNYSIGAVSARSGSLVGGFVGQNTGSHTSNDWDVDTSGVDQGTGSGNTDGITGLTDAQLKSGLPSGFDPTIWGQDPSINNGYPYLLANPPQK